MDQGGAVFSLVPVRQPITRRGTGPRIRCRWVIACALAPEEDSEIGQEGPRSCARGSRLVPIAIARPSLLVGNEQVVAIARLQLANRHE